jgi:DNA polymerase-3 subunit gamma/tau
MYFVFNKFSDAQLQETIFHVAKSENIHIGDNALHKLTSLASGHARDVLSMLEQLAMLTENNITGKDINDVFGLVEVQNKINFINQITSGDVNGSLQTLNSYYQQGINLEILCNDLFTIILDKIIYLQTNNTSILKILNEDTASQINLPLSTLFQIINIFEKKSATIKNSSDAKFYFECIILAIISEISQNSTVQPAKEEKQIVVVTTKASTKNKIADASTKQLEEPIKNNSNKLPDLKEIFSTKEFKQGNEGTKSNTSELNIENVFYAAAGSFNKQNLLNAQNYFDKIKKDKDQILQYVSNAVKPVIAGDDAIVLQYDDVVDAELLNHNLENAHFHEKIAKLLGKHMYFIGLTNKQLKKMSEDYLNNKKQVKLPKFANTKTILDLFDDTIIN